jgi:hypothetical protein
MAAWKQLDVRKLFILSHRWMGIAGGLLFVAWFISGIVFIYWTMPVFGNEERLRHSPPIDLSTARVEPMDAARNANIKPNRLRVGMYYDGRPIYRFQGNSIFYADTGELVGGRNPDQALTLVRQLEPSHADSVRYDQLLESVDLWTAGGPLTQLPLDKIKVGDPADTHYYISQKTGEPVMKTDRQSRFWGFLGPVLHQWYFTPLRRNAKLWDRLILWPSITGSLLCLSGLMAGVWQYSIRARYRKQGQPAHSPYSNWLWWHHYAGLIFGLVSLTWIFSGGLAFNSYGIGSNTNPTDQQRQAATGGPTKFHQVTLHNLRAAAETIRASFAPKELDILQFRGDLYVLAADGPADRPLIGLTERERKPSSTQYEMVWLAHPERGTFPKFDDGIMMDIAHEAMPNTPIEDVAWLNQYDNYYRSRLGAQPLPVLRVRYADAEKTWLYLDPHRGTIAWREQRPSRVRRWLYNGLHKFDLPYIYEYRPLWEVTIILLSVGGLVLSGTILIPGFRRLSRHIARLAR